jgi:hypothetical protein
MEAILLLLLLLQKVQGQRGDDWAIEKVMKDKTFEEVTDFTEVTEVTEVVLYCDRVVQLENRTDESQETCRSAYRRGAGSYFCPSRLERGLMGALSQCRSHPSTQKLSSSLVCRWFRFAQLAKGKKFRP